MEFVGGPARDYYRQGSVRSALRARSSEAGGRTTDGNEASRDHQVGNLRVLQEGQHSQQC